MDYQNIIISVYCRAKQAELTQARHVFFFRLQIHGFVWFDYLHPSQQFFSYVGTGLPWLNQYLARINVSCSKTQSSDAGEAQTHNPSVSSKALYHWATALPAKSW